ncbi:MAG TPA: fructosamine kinase family protein [Polyangiaceae bacterium]|jgi:fructosamine-3-kinase|nr:fructosamine kinase family protein [Polyangiaceae bacterium]
MQAKLRSAVEIALGSAIVQVSSVAGGDINLAYRIKLADDRVVFIKSNPSAPPQLFECEASGLDWLAQAGALPVPRVLALSSVDPQFLVLEYLESGAQSRRFDEQLGQGLAQLHRAGAPGFGFERENFIGRLPQRNTRKPDWATFYWECRLQPQIDLAVNAGLLSSQLMTAFESLGERLPQLVGDPEPPARLHGDLWGGNLHVGPNGAPYLIDPAVYGGHREVDLAMMNLFGGFSARVFDAYRESFPLSFGHQERVALYQLYPLLVHVNLFGVGYVGSVERAIRRYL